VIPSPVITNGSNTHEIFSIEKKKLADIKDVIQNCDFVPCKVGGGFIVLKMKYSNIIDPKIISLVTFLKDYLSLFKLKLALDLKGGFIINLELSSVFDNLLKEGFYFRMNNKIMGNGSCG